ncbi:MAG: vWA domain-containing protein [candidate division KSB1 bacterium]|nr:vWA domain-containing protein [candidate division KSB1 bacterium]
MEFSLQFAYNTWFFILGMLGFGLLAWWAYQITLPPVSAALRRLLLILRTLSFVFLFLLLFEPILGIAWRNAERPVVAVLVDVSASMQLPDEQGSRGEHLKSVLKQPWLNDLQKRFEVTFIHFASEATEVPALIPDSLTFDAEGTHISAALALASEKLSSRNFAATLLLSDGIYNLGSDPVQAQGAYPVPIFTVAFGRTTADRDVWIEDVLTNEVAFAGTRVPLQVMLRSRGYAGRNAQIRLMQGGRVVASQTVTLPPDDQEQTLQFSFVPDQEGMQKYRLVVDAFPDEVTDRNNQRTFYIKILKSKLKIVLLAGAPSPDVSFLVRTLKQDRNLKVRSYVALAPGKILGGTLPVSGELKDIDCVIGVQLFGPQPLAPVMQRWLERTVIQEEKPFLFISGADVSARQLAEQRKLLLLVTPPVVTREKQVVPRVTLQGMLHPILKITDESSEIKEAIEGLPPVVSPFLRLNFAPGAQVLLEGVGTGKLAARRGGVPLLNLVRQGQRRLVAFWGGGFWRWHLMMQRVQPGNDYYQRMFLQSIRWLVSVEESKLLRVSTNKDIYRTGEEILFSAQAYYEDFTPRDQLDIEVNIRGRDTSADILLQGRGNGLYEGKLSVLESGDYRYRATAREGDRIVGTDEGRFTVEPFRIEFQHTETDFLLMQRLAMRSGGRAVAPDSLAQWAAGLQFAPRITYEEKQFPLWQRWPMLAIIVLSLSLEWFLRKRKGMF